MKRFPKFVGREIIDLLIEFFCLATIFIVPLYFSVLFPTYNIFELGKLFIFKTIVWCLLLLASAKYIFFRPQGLHKIGKYLLVPSIFIVGLGVNLIFSGNIAQSFFGSYDRQAGYLSILFYFIWFVLLVFNIGSINNRFSKKNLAEENNRHDILDRNINRIIITVTLSGMLVAVYGILQILGIDFLTWPENPLFTRRTFSSLGQPNFLASWLLMVIPLSAYLIYKNRKFIIKFLYFLCLAAQLICLFFTSSRGAIVALCLTILISIIYLIFFIKLKKTHKIFAGVGLLAAIILSLWGLNVIIPGRVTSLLDINSGSSSMRVNFYSSAIDAIIKKPVFGYGLEDSSAVFISYYRPDWGVYSDVSATTDKAHNLVLDILLASGFFGLILYMIFYFYFFRLSFKNIVNKKMGDLSLALSLGGAAYLLSLLFSFSIVTGEIYFWLYLALVISINIDSNTGITESTDRRVESKNTKFKSFFEQIKILLFVLIAGLVAWGINYEFRVIEADHYFNAVYYTLAEKQYFTAFTLFGYLEGENTNSVNQEYYNRFLGDKLSDFYPEIKDLLAQKISLNKLNKIDNSLATGYYENDYVKAKINSILGNYSAAEKYFQTVTSKTPYWPKTYIDFGRLFVKEKNIKAAIVNYQLMLKILPDINDTRLNDQHKSVLQTYRKVIFISLGDIYFSLSNYSEAEKYYQEAYAADVHDFSIFKKIADTYYLRNNFSKAIEYNLRGATRNPQDYNWLLAAALIYKQEGNIKEAARYFNQAIKLAPDNDSRINLKTKYQIEN